MKIDEESGETIKLQEWVVLHLDVATHNQDAKCEIITSESLINHRETVKAGCEPIMSKSPNRHNKIFYES